MSSDSDSTLPTVTVEDLFTAGALYARVDRAASLLDPFYDVPGLVTDHDCTEVGQARDLIEGVRRRIESRSNALEQCAVCPWEVSS